MEKQELQRKITATVLATVVLCALLGVSIWLLLTTDVFTPLIKGLMVGCCVLLAAAIAGFLRNKLVEIRTLRLCMRDTPPEHEYSDVYGDNNEQDESAYHDSVETAAAFEEDFFSPVDDAFDDDDFTEMSAQDSFFDDAPAFPQENTFTVSELESTSFDFDGALPETSAQNEAPQAVTAPARQRPQVAAPSPVQAAPAVQAQQPRQAAQQRAAAQGQSVAPQRQTVPTAPQRPQQAAPTAQTQINYKAPTASSVIARQGVAPVQAVVSPQQPAQEPTQQPVQKSPQQPVAPRPLSLAQQQTIAYNVQLMEAQAAQHAATISAAQERSRVLQLQQEEAFRRRVQDTQERLAQQTARQRMVASQAVAHQQSAYVPPQPFAAVSGDSQMADHTQQFSGMYSQSAAQFHAPPQAAPYDPASAARAAQAAAAAQFAEREAQKHSHAANAAAQSAGEAASRSTEAATRAEARLRALAGLPPIDENTVASPAVTSSTSPSAISAAPAAVSAAPSAISAAPSVMHSAPMGTAAHTLTPVISPAAPLAQEAPVPKKPVSWLSDAKN